MIQEIVNFKAKDGVTLDGYIQKTDKGSKKILIQVHGMISNCFKKREQVISKAFNEIGIDALCFNNRGSEVAKLVSGSDGFPILAGSAFEEISECFFDICGAIDFVIERGYEEIYLQGHSLGATKVIYAYNEMIKLNVEAVSKVKALILLSLVDLPSVVGLYGKDYLANAEELVASGQGNVILKDSAFPYPLSAKTVLRYTKNSLDIDFAKFDGEDKLEVLNSFEVPLFFRWGNINEIALMDITRQIDIVKQKIKSKKIDIGYIDGANHSYYNKEEQLASEIVKFIKKIEK